MSKTVNKDRGYVNIEIGEASYKGRVNLNSIRAIENLLDKSILVFGAELSAGASGGTPDLRIDHIIGILSAVINEVGQVDEEEIADAVIANGAANGIACLTPVLNVLFNAEDKGEEGNL